MSRCAKCAAAISEGQSFCSVCGSRAVATQVTETARFCTGCGTVLSGGAKFCENCGAAVETETSLSASTPSASLGTRLPAVHSIVPAQAPTSSPATAAPPANSGSKFVKFLMIAFVAFVLLLLLGMGSCAYIAYRAKKRFNRVEQAYQ